MKNPIHRGDIYYANLSPVIGSEQGGFRPVIVIQNNIGNKHSPTVIVAAITSKTTKKSKLPTHYKILAHKELEKNSIVLLEQVRTIDKTRLGNYISSLDKKSMKYLNKALSISVGICEVK